MKTVSFKGTVERLKTDLPSLSEAEIGEYVEEFVDLHVENLTGYCDYEEEFADLIEAGILPHDKWALLDYDQKESFLDLWDIDYILEYIELAMLEDAPKSWLGRFWARVKAALRVA